MKRTISALSIFLLAAFALTAQPKIQIVGGDTYDWGNVKPEDSPLKCKIKIKNAGDKVLKILKVKPTCGCTTAPIDKKELKPGETATLDVKLNVNSYSENVHKSIRIMTNDPKNATKIVWLKAHVLIPITMKPRRYFYFPNMTVGSESEEKITLTNNTDKDITLWDFKTSPESLKINLNKKTVIKPGKSLQIVAKATPETVGSYRGSVTMKTDFPQYKTLSISVFGRAKKSPIFNNK